MSLFILATLLAARRRGNVVVLHDENEYQALDVVSGVVDGNDVKQR